MNSVLLTDGLSTSDVQTLHQHGVLRRCTQDSCPSLDIAGHTGLRADTGSGADPSMLNYTDLSAHDDTILDDDGPAEPGLRCNDHALAEPTVVSDVDQVVERCAASDAGLSEEGPINRRVGADLYLVLQHDAPAVGHADRSIGSRVQSESIGTSTQPAWRMQSAPTTVSG